MDISRVCESRASRVAFFRVASLLLPLLLPPFLVPPAAASVEDLLGPDYPLVGVSYSRRYAENPLPAAEAMKQISVHFRVVHFFDADPELLDAAAAQDLRIILSVPNEGLSELDSPSGAQAYVARSILPWQDNITGIIVGNEIFENGGQGGPGRIVPRMLRLVSALEALGITTIPVTTDVSLSVLAQSYPVDLARFKEGLKSQLREILQYTEQGPGFIFVNLYPWYALQADPANIDLDYATFRGPGEWCLSDPAEDPDSYEFYLHSCKNLFQAQYRAWNAAVKDLFPDVFDPASFDVLPGNRTEALVGETGWPSAGGTYPEDSTPELEGIFTNRLYTWIWGNEHGWYPSKIYDAHPEFTLLFEMYDEPLKPGGSQEPHWGLFHEDGTRKFALNIRTTPDIVSVYRPSNATFYLKKANETGFADAAITYGIPGDLPITGDWDGDGIDTIGVYRDGVFYLRNSNTSGYADVVVPFGIQGDVPVAGDWDGDGIDTIGVYRGGVFYLRNSNTSGFADLAFAYGLPGDVPIAGDWTGKGSDSVGLFRPSEANFYLKNTNASGYADAIAFFAPGDHWPVVGDWYQSGSDYLGLYRDGWFELESWYHQHRIEFGAAEDLPIAGRWGL